VAEFLVSLPLSELRQWLSRSEDKKRGFSVAGARISLLLDVAKGKVRSQRQYEDDWGWTRAAVRYHWAKLWQPVALWATSYGRQADPETYSMAANLPAPWLAWVQSPDNPATKLHATNTPLTTQESPISAQKGRSATTEQPHYNPPPSHNARARYPIPIPLKDTKISKVAVAFTTLDSSEGETTTAALLDLESEKKDLSRTMDAKILTFCESLGISEAVARRLARHENPAYVHAQIASYRAAGEKGAGWFVRSVDEGYDLRTSTPETSHSGNKPQTYRMSAEQEALLARRVISNPDDV